MPLSLRIKNIWMICCILWSKFICILICLSKWGKKFSTLFCQVNLIQSVFPANQTMLIVFCWSHLTSCLYLWGIRVVYRTASRKINESRYLSNIRTENVKKWIVSMISVLHGRKFFASTFSDGCYNNHLTKNIF